ncbi:MAG: helix-turn-helix domain-containing protein [Butyricicoccaceae bacterium]
MATEQKHLGKRINIIRKSRNITAEQLSEICNINSTYLRQIEGGTKTPSLPVFISICNALKISPNYLLQDELKPNELNQIQELTELWKHADPRNQAMAFAIVKAILEFDEK